MASTCTVTHRISPALVELRRAATLRMRVPLLFSGLVCALDAAPAPVQIFTSYGVDPTSSLTLTWASQAACAPVAEAGSSPSSLSSVACEVDAPFFFNNAGGVQFFYRARLTNLPASSRVFYRVGCSDATSETWSTIRSVSLVAPRGTPQTILLLGDMGRDAGEQTLPALIQEAQKSQTDQTPTFAIIAGDFGYDLHDFSGARGSAWMERVSNVTSFLPTMVTIGSSTMTKGKDLCTRRRLTF